MLSFRLVHRLFLQVRQTSFGRFDASRQSIIPGNQTGLLVGGLSSALVAFCVIIALSLSFIERLDTSAVDQPNLFILNVRNEDVTKIKDFDTKARLYDTILGRIVTINNRSLNDHLEATNKESGEFTREFNMTSQSLDNSPIIAGESLST
jgi:predicted lysophospholipase L1 biosynthesis ABC-type transport system permease subunit